jgi:glycerol uptake facilitator protein
VKWSQAPVYLAAELLAGIAAALLYGVLSRTPADHETAGPGLDLGDPEPEPEPAIVRQSSHQNA